MAASFQHLPVWVWGERLGLLLMVTGLTHDIADKAERREWHRFVFALQRHCCPRHEGQGCRGTIGSLLTEGQPARGRSLLDTVVHSFLCFRCTGQ